MDWTAVRAEFPVGDRWAFLDHAAVSPLPRRAARALCAYADDLMANGSPAVSAWVRRIEEARAAVAELIDCRPAEIAFTKNTTEAIGFVAEGFPWRDGDNVVLPAEEYPSNQYPWMNLASRGIGVRRVSSCGSRVPIDDLRAAIDSRTRLVAISTVEFSSGFRNDLDDIVQWCGERGVAVCVDAIQSLGALPFDVKRTPVEFLACGGHKWLCGPQGAGFLYVRGDWVERLRPLGIGAHSVVDPFNYTNVEFRLKPDAERWEGGTLNFGGLAALGESIRLWLEIGVARVARRIHELTSIVCDEAQRHGWSVFSSRAGDEWSGIVALDRPGVDPRVVAARAKNAGVIVAVRGGRLRVSPHCYNTADEIRRFAEILGE